MDGATAAQTKDREQLAPSAQSMNHALRPELPDRAGGGVVHSQPRLVCAAHARFHARTIRVQTHPRASLQLYGRAAEL